MTALKTTTTKSKKKAEAPVSDRELPVAPAHEATESVTAAEARPKSKNRTVAKTTKLSALDAAAKVLAETSGPMSTKQMIDAMAEKGYWSSPGGATPQATLYSAILREMKGKGADARFMKTERGKFALKA
jgi:hypothetical protein